MDKAHRKTREMTGIDKPLIKQLKNDKLIAPELIMILDPQPRDSALTNAIHSQS